MSFDTTILKGTTSKIVEVMLRDSSTGLGKTGLAHGSVTASYTREGSTRTAITLAAGTVGDAYSSGKWAEVDSTNCKGLYQLHIPNAALATGVNAVTITLQASGVIDKTIRIALIGIDLRDAVRAGMSALPNAAADAPGGLPVSDAGGLDLDNLVANELAAIHLNRLLAAPYDASAPVGDAQALLRRMTEHGSGGNPRYTSASLGNVQGQCNAALTAYDPPTRTELTADKNELLTRMGTPAGADIAADIAGVKSVADNLDGRLTAARAGYLDNLNVGGSVASQADILALNQSASRRIILSTVQQYERPESGNVTFTVEARTYDGDGAATNADGTPILTATGQTSGDLSGNLSAASNPATGVYRWTYTVSSAATIEQLRFDISATMTTVFTLSTFAQVVDLVSATWTTTNSAQLEAIYNKIPSTPYFLGTSASDGSGYATPANVTAAQTAIQGTQASNAQTGAAAAIAAADLDKLFAAAYDPDSKPGDASSLLNVLIESDSGVPRFTANALEQGPSGGGGSVTVTDITQAALAKFVTVNTGETVAVAGSVSQIAQGAAGDPWSTYLPGAYLAGSAGYLMGTWLPQISTLATSLAGTALTIVARVSGGTITAYIGDDYKVRSGTALDIPVDDPGGALAAKLNGYGVENLAFGASAPGRSAGEITGTIDSVTANSGTTSISVEITACGSGLAAGEYTYQVQSTQTQGDEYDDFVEVQGKLILSQRTVAAVG